MERFKYIIVEGPIGVGKTVLAELIAKEINIKFIPEQKDDLFLHRFYNDMRSYAFQTQIYFLLTRYKQQIEINQLDLFSQSIITDYMFAKDRIFAYINLTEEELIIYEKLYSLLNIKIRKPDLMIFLQADTSVIMQRIKRRGREYERNIHEDYIDKLNKAYNNFFFYYKDSPLLVVNTNNVDFVNNRAHFNDLINQIKEMSTGTKYYVPS
jgi:deoxyadenosine/deoxycytidine kinase